MVFLAMTKLFIVCNQAIPILKAEMLVHKMHFQAILLIKYSITRKLSSCFVVKIKELLCYQARSASILSLTRRETTDFPPLVTLQTRKKRSLRLLQSL